jgi:hypothetical protein
MPVVRALQVIKVAYPPSKVALVRLINTIIGSVEFTCWDVGVTMLIQDVNNFGSVVLSGVFAVDTEHATKPRKPYANKIAKMDGAIWVFLLYKNAKICKERSILNSVI